MSLKLLNGVVDIFKIDGKETIIIRGIIDPESMGDILVAPYQREVLPGSKVKTLMDALETSTVPDIELGMRGSKHRVTQAEGSNSQMFYLQDSVYVIDGLQRISAAKQLIGSKPEVKPRIGALVHLDTTEEWETERFRILNQERSKLNANILLRNLRPKSEALDMIFRLCGDETFVLCNRVQWMQRMARVEIIPATVLCQTLGYLHSRFGPGRGTITPCETASCLDKTMGVIGRTTMRDNTKTFFEVLDECFGVRKVVYHHGAAFIRRNFLICLADLFTRYENFWRGHRLFVEKDLRMKIAKFPINDPNVINLASSSGKAREILYMLILDHVNSGKRTRRLKLSDGMEPKELEAEDGVGAAPTEEVQLHPVCA